MSNEQRRTPSELGLSERVAEAVFWRLPYFHWWVKRGPLAGLGAMCGPSTGLSLIVPLPRMLPGFVKPYQVQSLRTREGRRGSDLTLFIPLVLPGWPHTSRTMRVRNRRRAG